MKVALQGPQSDLAVVGSVANNIHPLQRYSTQTVGILSLLLSMHRAKPRCLQAVSRRCQFFRSANAIWSVVDAAGV